MEMKIYQWKSINKGNLFNNSTGSQKQMLPPQYFSYMYVHFFACLPVFIRLKDDFKIWQSSLPWGTPKGCTRHAKRNCRCCSWICWICCTSCCCWTASCCNCCLLFLFLSEVPCISWDCWMTLSWSCSFNSCRMCSWSFCCCFSKKKKLNLNNY